MSGICGKQTIGCEVTSCRFNKRGAECSLNSITVRPTCNCNSGEENESLCASYAHKE